MERKWFYVEIETKNDKKSSVTVFNDIFRTLRNTHDVEEFFKCLTNTEKQYSFFNEAPEHLRRVFSHNIQFHVKFFPFIVDILKRLHKDSNDLSKEIRDEIIDILEHEVADVVKNCNPNLEDDDILYISFNFKDYAKSQLVLKCISEMRGNKVARNFIKFNFISSYNRNKQIKIAGTEADGVYASKLSVDDFVYGELLFTEKPESSKENPVIKINTEFAEFDIDGLKLKLHGVRAPEFNTIDNYNKYIKDVYVKMEFEFDESSDPKKSVEKYNTFSDFIVNNYINGENAFKCDNFKLKLKSVKFDFMDVYIENNFDSLSTADQFFREYIIGFMNTINPTIKAFNISKRKDEELPAYERIEYIVSPDPMSGTYLSNFEMNSLKEFKCPEQSLQK